MKFAYDFDKIGAHLVPTQFYFIYKGCFCYLNANNKCNCVFKEENLRNRVLV